jgi:hypothetical protein
MVFSPTDNANHPSTAGTFALVSITTKKTLLVVGSVLRLHGRRLLLDASRTFR